MIPSLVPAGLGRGMPPNMPGGLPGGLPSSLPSGLPSGLPSSLPGGLPSSLPGLQSLSRPPSAPGFPGPGATVPGLLPLPANLGGLPTPPGLPAPATGVPGLQANLLRPALPGLLRPLGMQAPGQASANSAMAASTSKASAPAPPGAVPTLGAQGQGTAPCTVYVGRISTEVSDDFVRQLLEKCGKVSKWNRAADPNTAKLTSFGFCDFEDPQGVWRALEFLHEKQLCDKRLLVKCEEKAKQTIDKWKESRRGELLEKRKKAAAGDEKKDKEEDKNKEAGKDDTKKENGDSKTEVTSFTDAQLDEELRKESNEAEEEVNRLLKEKNKGFPEVKPENSGEDKEEAKPEDESKPDAAKEKVDDKDRRDRGDKRDAPAANDRDRGRDNHRDRDRDRKRSPEQRLSRDEEKKRQREEERKAPVSRHYRVSRRERDREQRAKDRERDIDKEYQYRIREFERNEENRIKVLKRDLRDLELSGELGEREKRKLIDRDVTFGKSDSDERDWKRFREDRQRDRTREAEKDAADKKAEQEEIEEEKRRQEEEERKKRQEEEERKRKEREAAEAEARRKREEEQRRKEEELMKQQEELERKREEERKKREAELKRQEELAAAAKAAREEKQRLEEEARAAREAEKITASFNSKNLPGSTPVTALFREPEELDSRGQPRKHKPLTRLEGPTSGGTVTGGEVKLRDDEMRRLIQQVPTDKAKAFAYKIDWESVEDYNIIEKKLRPWVKKKVTEYLGSEEHGMIEFIMKKVNTQTKPDIILRELESFLDEEAENFTLKMWRMLIFEVLRVKAR